MHIKNHFAKNNRADETFGAFLLQSVVCSHLRLYGPRLPIVETIHKNDFLETFCMKVAEFPKLA